MKHQLPLVSPEVDSDLVDVRAARQARCLAYRIYHRGHQKRLQTSPDALSVPLFLQDLKLLEEELKLREAD